jgi:hypothetical protein
VTVGQKLQTNIAVDAYSLNCSKVKKGNCGKCSRKDKVIISAKLLFCTGLLHEAPSSVLSKYAAA